MKYVKQLKKFNEDNENLKITRKTTCMEKTSYSFININYNSLIKF